MIYGLLQIFDFQQDFMGKYEYEKIENDFQVLLGDIEDTASAAQTYTYPNQVEKRKSYSEYCANIRLFYCYLYISSIQKLIVTQKIT